MGDREGLLESIRTNPSDDIPRLVFADWLDECGTTSADREMAKFIRVQYPPVAEHQGPRVRRWDRYASNLLTGVIPKSWKVWLLPTPGSLGFDVLMRAWSQRWVAEWGRPPVGSVSWHTCVLGPFADESIRIRVAIRHGFICALTLHSESSFIKMAPALFRTQPIEWAIFSDKTPNASGRQMVWSRGQDSLDLETEKTRALISDLLHPDLFDLLPGGDEGHDPAYWGGLTRTRAYIGRAAAYEALGRACVDWGRKATRTVSS
jgi:uncharacterized protein (TIGR02996 family)